MAFLEKLSLYASELKIFISNPNFYVFEYIWMSSMLESFLITTIKRVITKSPIIAYTSDQNFQCFIRGQKKTRCNHLWKVFVYSQHWQTNIKIMEWAWNIPWKFVVWNFQVGDSNNVGQWSKKGMKSSIKVDYG